MRPLALAVAALVVLEGIALFIGLQLMGAPVLLGAWPSGVTQASLRGQARAALDTCAASSDASPRGCPQGATTLSSPVTWTVVGDPVRHAGFEMSGSSGAHHTFQVWGDVAMAARSADGVATWEGPFIARVEWDGSSLRPAGVRRGQFDMPPAPEATDAAARQAAASAFRRCGASPDPLVCPSVEGAPASLSPSGSWTDGARVVHVASTGVTHVRGRITGPYAAGFDASEVVDASGRMTCYAIAYSP